MIHKLKIKVLLRSILSTRCVRWFRNRNTLLLQFMICCCERLLPWRMAQLRSLSCTFWWVVLIVYLSYLLVSCTWWSLLMHNLAYFVFFLFALTKCFRFKIRKCNHNHSHIIKRTAHERVLKNVFHTEAALLMDTACKPILYTVPAALHCLFIGQFVKYPITPHDYEIMIFCYFERFYLWSRNNYIWIPPCSF